MLWKNLRSQKLRKKRYGTISNRASIDDQAAIVERKTGFTLIQKVERKTALAVSQAMIGLLKPHRKKVHTITSDNGKEFAWHEREHEWINMAVLPKKPGLHNNYATGDQYGDGEIEQPTQKETWVPDT